MKGPMLKLPVLISLMQKNSGIHVNGMSIDEWVSETQ